jgi:hypothetical protein
LTGNQGLDRLLGTHDAITASNIEEYLRLRYGGRALSSQEGPRSEASPTVQPSATHEESIQHLSELLKELGIFSLKHVDAILQDSIALESPVQSRLDEIRSRVDDILLVRPHLALLCLVLLRRPAPRSAVIPPACKQILEEWNEALREGRRKED